MSADEYEVTEDLARSAAVQGCDCCTHDWESPIPEGCRRRGCVDQPELGGLAVALASAAKRKAEEGS